MGVEGRGALRKLHSCRTPVSCLQDSTPKGLEATLSLKKTVKEGGRKFCARILLRAHLCHITWDISRNRERTLVPGIYMVSCRCALPLHPWSQLGEPGPIPIASRSRSSHREDRAFDFWAILDEKAGVVHKHSIQVLGFKVNVFQEKAVHLGFLQLCRVQPYPRSMLGPLASWVAGRAQPVTAHSCCRFEMKYVTMWRDWS